MLDLNGDKSLYTEQTLTDGYFTHGRAVACDPNHGLIATLSHNMFTKIVSAAQTVEVTVALLS